MSTFNSKRFRVLLLGLGVAAGLIYGTRQPSPLQAAPTDAPEGRPGALTLRQERLATLRKARDIADRMLAAGTGSFDQLDRVNHMLLDAELASATTQKERIDILNAAVKDAEKQEALSEQRAKSGLGTALEPLEARAYRLGLQIRMDEEGAEKGRG